MRIDYNLSFVAALLDKKVGSSQLNNTELVPSTSKNGVNMRYATDETPGRQLINYSNSQWEFVV